MAINWNFGVGAQSGTVKTLSYYPWVYDTAIRVTGETPTLTKFTGILAPLDKPMEIKISTETIANVYTTLANTRIPVSEQSSNTSGTSVFMQLRTTVDYVKTVGTTSTTVQLPLEARLQVRVPNDSQLTDVEINKLVAAAFACSCQSDGTSRFGEIIRGSLVPKEI